MRRGNSPDNSPVPFCALELNQRLCSRAVDALPDALAQYADLADFDIYAGDGHWHGAAAHDAPIDGTKYAVGHFFALDLRRHTLRHLAVGVGKKSTTCTSSSA